MFGNMMRYGFYGPGYGFNNFGFIYGISFMGLFFILIGILIYFMIKQRNKSMDSLGKNIYNNEALAIAKVRYAKGEISLEEYQKIVKILNE